MPDRSRSKPNPARRRSRLRALAREIADYAAMSDALATLLAQAVGETLGGPAAAPHASTRLPWLADRLCECTDKGRTLARRLSALASEGNL